MDIFQNDSQVLQIANLTVENGQDSILIVGDVEIEKTQIGKQQAQILYDFAKELWQTFEKIDDLPETLPKNSLENDSIENPFA
ncbi:MAG: hypothetical protein ACTTGU_01910 [Moraxella sp.]